MATITDKAKQLRDPDPVAIAASPEHPEDLPTVDQVDWTQLIVAALGPNTTLDKPLPQLLLRLGEVVASLTDNAEHLKGFVGGTGRDQEDLAGSVAAALKRNGKRGSDTATALERLTLRVEQLEAERAQAHAFTGASTVQH